MDTFGWIAFALITVTSAARLTRLATADKFPPVAWLREQFIEFTDKHPRLISWQLIAYCGYCAGPWLTALVVGWAALAGVTAGEGSTPATVWWFFNGVLGGSYLASMMMAYDGDETEDDD